jgi:hypothetical protein
VNETKSYDDNKCTALIWAAFRGYIPLVEYLIENGADVNHSCEGASVPARTPLLCATLAGHVQSVRRLYEAGAEINIKNDFGDTPLMTAVKKKYYSIINFLLERSINTPEDLEVIVCSSINVFSSNERMHEVIELLKLALQHRESMHIPKVCIEPNVAYNNEQECQTIDELNSIADDRDRILIETLLIRERLYSSRSDITIMEPLEGYSDRLTSNEEYDKSLNVNFHIFYLCQKMDLGTILHRFVWLFCRMLTANRIIHIDRFIQACYLTFDSSQSKCIEKNINNALFLVIIATKVILLSYCILSHTSFIYLDSKTKRNN